MRIEEVCSCRRARQPARALCVSVQSYGRFVFQWPMTERGNRKTDNAETRHRHSDVMIVMIVLQYSRISITVHVQQSVWVRTHVYREYVPHYSAGALHTPNRFSFGLHLCRTPTQLLTDDEK